MLAFELRKAKHMIKFERLAAKLLAISHRVNGPDHIVTKSAKSALSQWKVMRTIDRVHEGKVEVYEALRYEYDGDEEMLIVKGPIPDENNCTQVDYQNIPDHNHKIFPVAVTSSHIIYDFDTPVVCHGLKNAQHLNGKIGELRSFDDKSLRYEVHFEDPKLKPCLVKPENVKILFELPKGDHVE